MPYDPLDVICEILGQPAREMYNPVNADYECPYTNSVCSKRSQRIAGPYPVCTVYRLKDKFTKEPVIVCPKRFYEANLFEDVITYGWGTNVPSNPVFVHEIKMGEFGTVDFVVADINQEGNNVADFVSVELQAIDITGSYEPAYTAHILGNQLESKPTYNFNYANVRKRYISQLITKGFYHHHWGTRIVAVVQDVIYDYLKESIKFSDVQVEESNILFFRYRLEEDGEGGEKSFKLRLSEVSGTTHSALMMSAIYKQPPSKNEFCKRILTQIGKL